MTAERLPVASWVLRQQRRGLALWALAIAAISAMYTGFYPLMGTSPEMQALVDDLPEAFRAGMGWDAITTATGYLNSTVYALIAPVLLLVFAVATGARVVAGEEEAGALELELTSAVSRRRVLLERAGSLVAGLVVVGAALALVTIVMVSLLDMDVTVGGVLAAALGLVLFALAVGSVTLAVGAVTGRRGLALAVGAAVGVLSYVSNALGRMLDDGRWLEALSPFAWYVGAEPLVEGVDPAGYAGLLAISVVALAVALVVFDRRDVGV